MRALEIFKLLIYVYTFMYLHIVCFVKCSAIYHCMTFKTIEKFTGGKAFQN